MSALKPVNVRVVNEGWIFDADILITDGRIAAIGSRPPGRGELIW